MPYLAQGLAMLERNVATADDIDTAMRLGAGHPMVRCLPIDQARWLLFLTRQPRSQGPITLSDYVGLDTLLSILKGWRTSHPTEPAFIVPKILEAKVAEGKLGRKSGEGFFKWNGNKRA